MPTLFKAALLALLCSAPALLWSATAYHWDEPGFCQWQEQEEQQLELDNWQWALLAGDTIRPIFATHSCDLICPEFPVNQIVVSATCGQNDGSAKVEPVGYSAGTTFSYAWSGNVSTTNEADSLAAGIYYVTISVAVSGNGSFRNCDTEAIVPVSNVGGPEVEVTTVPANCMSEAGRVTLNITSGTPPFTISWTGGTRTANGLGTVQFTNLATGTYTFVVTDANGCKTALIGEVGRDNSGMFDVFLTATPISACGANDGTVTVRIEGDFPPYQITLNNLNTITTSTNPYTFTNLPAGLYRVNVKGALLCEEERDVQVRPPGSCNAGGWTAEDADCSDAEGSLEFNGSGAAHETYEVRQKNSTFVILTVRGNETATIAVPAGEYRIKRISSQDACICEFKLVVNAPEELKARVDKEDCEATGVDFGSITVVAITGGTSPYSVVVTDSAGVVINSPYSNLATGKYNIVITDANNCQPLTKEVEIDSCCGPIEVAATPADTIICEGELVTLQAIVTSTDPAGAITWFDEAGVQLGTGATLALTPPAGVNQYIVVAESSCSTDTDTARARVKVAPNAPLVADPDSLLVCTNDPVTINVSGPLSECVIWLNSNGEPIDTGIQLTVVPLPGVNQYVATLPGAEACVTPDTVIIEYRPGTVVAVEANGPSKVCEGDEVCLQADFTPDDGTVSITWQDISGATLGNDRELCVTPAAGVQEYRVIASNGCSADTATATVTVLSDTTQIEIAPADTTTLCASEEICFEVTDTTLWDCIEWVDASGAIVGTGGSLCVTPSGFGIYCYTAQVPDSLGLGCILPGTACVKLVPDTLNVTVEGSTKVCEGDSICLSAAVGPDPLMAMATWTDETGAVVGTGLELCITPPPGTHKYTVTVDNGCTTAMDMATVRVLSDTTQIEITPADTTTLCASEEICFEVTDTTLWDCIEWVDASGAIVGTGGSLCVTPSGFGIYCYTAQVPDSLGLGCILPGTACVKLVPDTLNVTVEGSTKVCEGDSICLSAAVGPDPLMAMATWTDETGAVVGTGLELCITPPPGTHKYTVTVDNGCTTAMDMATVRVLSDTTQIEITPADTTTLCASEEICFEVTDTTLWDCIEWVDASGAIVGTGGSLCVTPSGFGIYCYTAQVPDSLGLGCILPGTACVKLVPDTLNVTVEGPTKVCEGDSLCLTATIGPDPLMAMATWTDESGTVVGTGLELCITPPPGTHKYTVTVDNGCTTAMDMATVRVLSDTTQIEITPADTTTLCASEEICFEVTDTTLWDCIEWVDASGAIVGTGGSLCVTPSGFGIYCYTAQVPDSLGLGCILPGTACVKLVPDTLNVTVEGPTKVCEGDSLCLTATIGPDPLMAMATWTDESGAVVGTGLELCITPPPGTHKYTVTVDNGCTTAMDMATVRVLSDTTQIEITPADTTTLCASEEICFEVTDTTLWDCIEWVDASGAIVGTGGSLCVTPSGFGIYCYTAQVPDSLGLGCILPGTACVKLVPDTLNVTVEGSTKVCEGDSICLSATVGPDPLMAMATWTDETGAVVGTGLELCVTPGAGTHKYTVTVDNGCTTAMDMATVRVLSDTTQIEITPADTTTLCASEEICFEVTDTTLWDCIEWVDASGAIVGTGGSLCVTPPGFGIYCYTAQVPDSLGLGCILPGTACVKLVPDTLNVTVEGPTKVCEGDSICLSATVGPDPLMAMATWTDESGAVVGTGLELCITPPPGTHKYTVTVDNGCTTAMDMATVRVLSDTTQIEITPADTTTLCASEEICFEVTDTTLWDCIEWVDASGAIVGTGGSLCVTPPGFGIYCYTAQVPDSLGLGCILPGTACVKLVPDTLNVTVEGPTKVCEGDSICLSATVGPDPLMAMATWTDETGAVVGTGLELCVVPGAGTHKYTVTVDNGCATAMDMATVRVLSDTTKIEITPADTVMLCAPEEVCFTVTDTTLWDCIQWVDAGGAIVGTGGSLCVMPTDPGLYWYVAQVDGTLRCVIPDTAYVKLLPDSLNVSIDGPMKVCEGDSVCLTATVGPDPLMAMATWTDETGAVVGTGLELCVTPGAGTHKYTVTVDNGCATAMDMATVRVLSDTTKIEITPADTVTLCAPEEVCFTVTDTTLWDCIQWVDAGGAIVGTGGSLCVMPTDPGLYWYVAQVDGTLRCVIPDTAYVKLVPDSLSVSVDGPMKVCEGDSICLSATVGPDPLMAMATWTDETGAVVGTGLELCVTPGAGTHKYTVTVDNGCATAMDMATVRVLSDTTKIEITPADTVMLCAPEEVCFTVTDTTLWDCIQWVDAGGAIVGTGGSLCVMPTDPGLYWYVAQVDGTLRCVIPDTAYVKLLPDSLNVSIDGPMKVCEGDSVCLTATVGPDPLMAMATWTDETGAVVGTGLELCVTPGAGTHKYTVTVDNGCTTAMDMATVRVLSDTTKIEITPADTVTLCAPEEVCFTVTDTTLWDCIQWIDAGGAVVGTGGSLCVMPTDPGLYWYVAQVDGTLRCVIPDTAYVKLLPDSLNVSIDGPMKVCEGDSVCLTATVGPDPLMAMATWTDEAGAVIGTGLELCVTPGAGTHKYTVTVDNGCATAMDMATVRVLSDTTKIEITPADTVMLCAPEEVCFTVTDTTLWDCIQWVDAGGAIVGTGGSLCVMPTDPGLYWYVAQVDGTLRCVIPDTAYVKLVPDSLNVSIEGPMKVCEGDSVCLTATVGPDPLMAMATWTDETGAVVGTGLELCVTPGAGMHKYTVTVDNGCTTAMDMATVRVLSDTTKIEITPADTVMLCAPEEVCFTVTDTTLWDCIQWVDAGGAVVGTGGSLCVMPTDPGLYWYVAQVDGTLRCVIPDTAYVKLMPEDLSVMVTPDTSKLCVGETATLTAVLNPPDPTATIFWTLGTDPVGSGPTLSVTPDAPGSYTYTATVETECGMASASGVVIVVADSSKIEITPSDTLLCEAEIVCLTATGPVPDCVVWTNIQGENLGTGAELCVLPTPGVSYYIASIPGLDCVIPDTATIRLSVPEISVEVMPSDTIVCRGDSVKLTANVMPDDAMADIIWYDENYESLGETGMMITVSPDTTGEFTYIAIADNGCAADTASATVTVVDSMKLVITPADTILCAPDTLKLSVEGTGSDYVIWYDERGDSIGTGMMITVVPDYGIHTYSAQIPEADCVEGDTVMVKVLPDSLDLTVTASDSVVCVGDEITFTAQLEPDWTMAQVTWFDEVGEEAGSGDTLVVTAFAGPNIYYAVADNGCVMASDTAAVEGKELSLEISADPPTICADRGEQSQLSVTECEGCTYSWDNTSQTLSDPNISNPVATPNVTTTYTVTVTDGVCTETLSVAVTVEDCPEECPVDEFYIATAFTPNNDNVNDVVCLRSEHFDKFSEIELMIYNRWGEEVFRESYKVDPSTPGKFPTEDFFCWDGMYKGKVLPPDVYGYYLRIVCPETDDRAEEVREQKGNISLLQR